MADTSERIPRLDSPVSQLSGDIKRGARVMMVVGRVSALAIEDDLSASVVRRQKLKFAVTPFLFRLVPVLSTGGAPSLPPVGVAERMC
ncbi:hypothetical protein [Mycobacterium sp. Aquia_213]|uniref:hypothetical protein n=1 Tax=Mycobacterium sp. Aquia_213 TaxID=2991728 RepID=UPI00226EA71D|nr:hypothetical protein [Mycobacterium sp. Aquia_213]WAC90197.1 hypothetical protein LMQ14_20015 [Mycobacterium sp. Aquia_213]